MSSLVHYRPFLNCDPPALIHVWQQQSPGLGLMQPMSSSLLEMFVFSKPYFDRQGLIVASHDGEIVGFAHAGFGPNANRTSLNYEEGIICVLLVRPHERRVDLLEGLLDQCEAYFGRHQVKEIRVGASFPDSPFYLGLLGGSDLPGVSSADPELEQLYRRRGYTETDRSLVFERNLDRSRLAVDRVQLQHRRNYQLVPQVNPRDLTWWDACVFGPTDRIRFMLMPKGGGAACGSISFWDMGPLSTRPLGGGMGLLDLQIADTHRRQGLGVFLLSESMRHLQNSGIHRVETQTLLTNVVGQKLLSKVGFTPLSTGIQFRRVID